MAADTDTDTDLEAETPEVEAKPVRKIQIAEIISVGDLAEKLEVPVTSLMAELMKSGIMATVNERIDFDTASLVIGDYMPEVELSVIAKEEAVVEHVARKLSDKAELRPPVAAVMGHVDHGKTSLLDAIRGSKVAEGEAGGITQHISAYQIKHGDRAITFLDTPGHEAFAAIRQHGARLTDVAVIVIAADDGIKPQTKEAIRFAQQAGVKIIVAINKIDKPGADVSRVKQDLANNNLMTEEWGGDTVTVEVSAKTGKGIDQLMDMILLVADVEELKAEVDIPAEGLIIEAHMETGRGPVAKALVEHGTLKPGMSIHAGGTYAKIKTLENSMGEPIAEAGPSTPVVITGFKSLPEFGDIFTVASDKGAKSQAAASAKSDKESGRNLNMTSTEMIRILDKRREQEEIPLIIRADVQGSLTSVLQSVQALEHEEVRIRVIGTGVGNITENDVSMAAAAKATIYGFGVDLPVAIKRLAAREGVKLKVFNVIYELLDDIKVDMSLTLAPEVIETELGRLVVKGVFRTTKNQVICGGEVTKGKIKPGVLVSIERGGEIIGEAESTGVQRGQQDAKEVVKGEMCGLDLKTKDKVALEVGDKLNFFTRTTKTRSL